MAAIYDKALKRKDYSGVIDKKKNKAAEEAPTENGQSTSEFSYFFCYLMLNLKKKRRPRQIRRPRRIRLKKQTIPKLELMSERL
jgi:hypothetical protein